MLIDALESGKGEWSPAPVPATMKEIVETYEKQSASIAERLAALPDARWDGSAGLFGKQRPASPMAWSFLFDIVHHRGQITTYLRPMGSTVPQIYGPSADEPWRHGVSFAMMTRNSVLVMMVCAVIGTTAGAQRAPESIEVAFVANAEGAEVAMVDVAARAIIGTIAVNFADV